jgi:hypothetical protein
MKIELTNFVKRQWDSNFAGTKMHQISDNLFLDFVNVIYENCVIDNHKSWEFCKYVYFKNPYEFIKTSTIKIDYTNYQYIQSGYFSRTDKELDVLSRWMSFPKDSFKLPKAEYIGLVLYSKEQLLKEFNADPAIGRRDMNGNRFEQFELSDDCKYGIVAIIGLNQCEMDPMLPITHFRNALGKEYGGNSESIDIEEYQKSIIFWKDHILVKDF